ncbi:hypothetical protein B5E53_00335 [Eubacterium sp. An11]|nr:hypothetical protein B5E53_00335 [Eubacterium sp. An11]
MISFHWLTDDDPGLCGIAAAKSFSFCTFYVMILIKWGCKNRWAVRERTRPGRQFPQQREKTEVFV